MSLSPQLSQASHQIQRKHARIKVLEQALRDVKQAFHDNGNPPGQHPWIPGADAPRVIAIIDAALGDKS